MALKVKGQLPPAKTEEVIQEEMQYGLRVPTGPTEFEAFEATLSDDQKPYARKLFRMACVHGFEVVMEDVSWSEASSNAKHVVCHRCGFVCRQQGSRAAMLRQEWDGYCPDGYDAFDWAELFVTDKSLWPFIHDEVEYVMLETSMTKEDE